MDVSPFAGPPHVPGTYSGASTSSRQPASRQAGGAFPLEEMRPSELRHELCSPDLVYSLATLTKCMGLRLGEFKHCEGYGFGKVLNVTTCTGREIRVNRDDFNSGRGLLEAAMVKVLRESGRDDAKTLTHIASRAYYINGGRPYGSFPGDHYAEYVACSKKLCAPNWIAREYHTLLNEGELAENRAEIPNSAYTYNDLMVTEIENAIRFSDNHGVRARFTFSDAYMGRQAFSRVSRLYTTDGGYGVHIPRKDLQPMSSGLEDTTTLEEVVLIIRSWAARGDLDFSRVKARSAAPQISFGTISKWGLSDIPDEIKDVLFAVLDTPQCQEEAQKRGITERSTANKDGDVAPKYFMMLVSKIRWAIGDRSDQYILQCIHYAITHQIGLTRSHNFKDCWKASVWFMAARARSLEVGYYSGHSKTKVVHPWSIPGFGTFPGGGVHQDMAVRLAALRAQDGKRPGHSETEQTDDGEGSRMSDLD